MTNDVNSAPPATLVGIADVSGSRRLTSDKQETENATQSPPERSRDTVALTDGARLLQKVESELANAADVDVTRVNALKDAVADGSYKIDDRTVADKILRSDTERSS